MFLKALLVLMLLPAAAMAQQTGDLESLRQRALELVNEDRDSGGLPPLELGETLDRIALSHVEDMLKRDYYAHVSPEGNGPRDRYLKAGGSRWELVAENIARCTGCQGSPDLERLKAFQTGWMNSPEHRENILRKGLTRFGFGIVAGDGVMYAAQTFAGPGTSRGDDATALDGGDATAIAVDRLNAARSEQGLEPVTASDALAQAARKLVPEDLEGFDLDRMPPLGEAFGANRPEWRRITAVAGACGGCGGTPVRGDVRAFVSDWLDQGGANRQRLLDPAARGAGHGPADRRIGAQGGGAADRLGRVT